MADDPEILTPTEVSEMLKIHRITLYKLIRKGMIPAFRIGGDRSEWRFRKDEIQRWIAEGSAAAMKNNVDPRRSRKKPRRRH